MPILLSVSDTIKLEYDFNFLVRKQDRGGEKRIVAAPDKFGAILCQPAELRSRR